MILILFIVISQLSCCNSVLQPVSINSMSQNKSKITDTELERSRRLWEDSKIVDYNFVSSKFQGGQYVWVPVLIQVRNGKAISTEPIRERAELEKIEGYEEFDTVEKIFDKIQARYDNGDKVIVTYNKEFGYPENTRIEPKKGGIDTGFSIVISKFEIVRTN